jgi:hypothetical protein
MGPGGGPVVQTAVEELERLERFLDAVVDTADTDPVKHMRLAAIRRCHVLRGGELVDAWRVRASRYPDQLVTAMVEQTLTPTVLTGWSARDALVSRGDHIAIQRAALPY